MRARKVIARSSLFIWVIACGSLVSSAQHGGAEPKSENRYPLITCEAMKPPRSKLRGIIGKIASCETPRFLTLFPLQGNP